jgi:hypothetical protein
LPITLSVPKGIFVEKANEKKEKVNEIVQKEKK